NTHTLPLLVPCNSLSTPTQYPDPTSDPRQTICLERQRQYHPKVDISSLTNDNGGINLPIIKVETEIRLAKTLTQAYLPHPPFWIHVNNHIMQTRTTHNDIIQSITQRRSIRLPIEPLR